MNKKVNLFLALLLGSVVAFAQQSDIVAEPVVLPTDSLGIHPYDGNENDNHIVIDDQSHWSMYLGAGFNLFDGDFISEQKSIFGLPSVSLGGAYHWNNTWGIGAEYKFRCFHVAGKDPEQGQERTNAADLLKGSSHQAGAYLSFDVFNAFRPQNKKKLFALDLLLGGGAIWTKRNIYYLNHYKSSYNSDVPFINDTEADRLGKNEGRSVMSDDKYTCAGVFFGGVSAEFNINRSIQLGLRGLYNYTTSDNIDGRKRSNNNDGFFDCEVVVRYKFEPRDKSNVRNFMVDKHIDNWNTGVFYENPEMGAAKRAKYATESPVQVVSQKDTVYIITRDTVYVMSQQAEPVVDEDIKSIRNFMVFFANDVYQLDKPAMNTTGEAALLLGQREEYYAVVVGSCDNTGAIEYNKWLAVQRARQVADALQSLGVARDRIYTVGRGIMQDNRAEGSWEFNRRVEILIVDKEELEKQKSILSCFEKNNEVQKTSAVRKRGEENASSSKAEACPAPVNGDSIAEPAAKSTKEIISESYVQVGVLDTVVANSTTTLSRLARRYYNNTDMWVKIYEANSDHLASPSSLTPGDVIIIPALEKK